jgi:ubiquinone/menaquinone biosynthesis C-methylase UbiE
VTEPAASAAALGLPDDYYERIFEVEERHWWHRGMRTITAALLGPRLERSAQRILDAGCGTGGFLRWALGTEAFETGAGVDVSPDAIELARRRVPECDLQVAPLSELPFPAASFDVVTMNDVLQHIPEDDVEASLAEVRRVIRPDGVLLVRAGGARRARRERPDWRVYDPSALRATLEPAGFSCDRITYASLIPSLAAAAKGHTPRAPTREHSGIPAPAPGARGRIAYGLLRAEAALIARTRLGLPYGHTLFALALPKRQAGSSPTPP